MNSIRTLSVRPRLARALCVAGALGLAGLLCIGTLSTPQAAESAEAATSKAVTKKVLKISSLKVTKSSSTTSLSSLKMTAGSTTSIKARVSTKKAKTKLKTTASKKAAKRKSVSVTFTSNKPSVVSVKKTSSRTAKLYAHKAGTATITVRAKAYNTKVRTFKVTVKKSSSPVVIPDNTQLTQSFAASSASAVLAASKENACYSPISAYLCMSMVGAGASGKTQQQIVSALGASSADELIQNSNLIMSSITEESTKSSSNGSNFESIGGQGSNATLKFANSIWSGTDFSFTPTFKNVIKTKFDGEAKSVNFADPATGALVGKWVSDNTNGLLNPEFSFDSNTLAALVNTVYFKDNWLEAFRTENTTKRDFTNTDKSVSQVDFMQTGTTQSFYKGSTYSAASMPLTSGATMTFYLPAEGTTANDLLATKESTAELLNTKMSTYGTVDWKMPKFSTKSTFDLNGMLNGLGITSAFDENYQQQNGEFLSMLTPNNVGETRVPVIDWVEQGTRIGVDEQGVEAAAYTAVIMKGTGCPPITEHLDLDLNRSFAYSITAKDGTVLFMGTVNSL